MAVVPYYLVLRIMCVKVCRYGLVSMRPPGSNEFDDLKMPGLYYDCCGDIGDEFSSRSY